MDDIADVCGFQRNEKNENKKKLLSWRKKMLAYKSGIKKMFTEVESIIR